MLYRNASYECFVEMFQYNSFQSCGKTELWLNRVVVKTELWYKTVKVEIVFFVIFQPEIWNCRNLFYSNKTNLVKLSQSFQL